MAQAALDPRAGRTLAITGGFEFGNKASLLVLMKSPCELPHLLLAAGVPCHAEVSEIALATLSDAGKCP